MTGKKRKNYVEEDENEKVLVIGADEEVDAEEVVEDDDEDDDDDGDADCREDDEKVYDDDDDDGLKFEDIDEEVEDHVSLSDHCPTCLCTGVILKKFANKSTNGKYCQLCESFCNVTRNIGSHLKIVNPVSGKATSRLRIYTSKGNKLIGGNKNIKEENLKSPIIAVMKEEEDKKPHNRGDSTNEESQMKVENLILTCFPNSAFAKFVRQLATVEGDIAFEAMTEGMFLTIWQILTSPRNKRISWEEVDIETGQVMKMVAFGRNNGYKTMTKVVTVINKFHALAGKPSPANEPIPQKWIRNACANYEAKGAVVVDPATALPMLYRAMWDDSDNDKSNLEKIRNWLMFLLMWVMFARPSEIYNFCPCIGR
jgi:hypothetical protein